MVSKYVVRGCPESFYFLDIPFLVIISWEILYLTLRFRYRKHLLLRWSHHNATASSAKFCLKMIFQTRPWLRLLFIGSLF